MAEVVRERFLQRSWQLVELVSDLRRLEAAPPVASTTRAGGPEQPRLVARGRR